MLDSVNELHQLLRMILERAASDLFITCDYPPALRIDGKVYPIDKPALNAEAVTGMVHVTLSEQQREEFAHTHESNLSLLVEDVGRFRVNVFMQRGKPGMVFRPIKSTIPTMGELGLPDICKELAMTKRGLVIITGGTGSGKTTTLASMIGYRNHNSHGHIVTIEDPIEFTHEHDNCLMTQREVGIDTEHWETALVNVLRQAPDVIVIGECRRQETMETALQLAETGHLCLTTLHANNTHQTLDRIINMFPHERREQLMMDLSINLKGILSQRLIGHKSAPGRVLAMEVLINTPRISDLIFRGQLLTIKDTVSNSREQEMCTFDQALFDLYLKREISMESALRHADSKNDLRLRIKIEGLPSDKQRVNEAIDSLRMMEQ